ncbi:hypothetical protein AEGHOMDF_1895 [Methylobacterium soli]|nr:hypothetical protein AEGHOMDF_1895 [Methylobacterium soli]
MSSTPAPRVRGLQSLATGAVQPASSQDRAVRALLARRPSLQRTPTHIADGYNSEVISDVRHALDRLYASVETTGATQMASELIDMLQLLKDNFAAETWYEAVVPTARGHRIAQLVHECPFTRHSFTRPRGYPGDAGLLDYVYRHPDAQPAIEAASSVGRGVMSHTINVSACEAVRRRKDTLAAKIDETARRRPDAEILAVACGHLREVESSSALGGGGVRRLLATDQDEGSLKVAAAHGVAHGLPIVTQKLNVRNFITARQNVGEFDFIYAAGLYDYLDARVAARLTRSLFGRLKSGGRLLIPNFRTGIREEAFMEAYMDWFLLYRTKEEIEAFSSLIPHTELSSVSYWDDELGEIGYLEIEKQ